MTETEIHSCLQYEILIVVLPPGPRCRRCGHEMCPCCGMWCDLIIGEDCDPCCDMACDVDIEAVSKWQERIRPMMKELVTIVTAEGPCEYG